MTTPEITPETRQILDLLHTEGPKTKAEIKAVTKLKSASDRIATLVFLGLVTPTGKRGNAVIYAITAAGSAYVTLEPVHTQEAPVAESPVAETPVVETPVAETPVVETPVAETPAPEVPAVSENSHLDPMLKGIAGAVFGSKAPVATPVAETPAPEKSTEQLNAEIEEHKAALPTTGTKVTPKEKMILRAIYVGGGLTPSEIRIETDFDYVLAVLQNLIELDLVVNAEKKKNAVVRRLTPGFAKVLKETGGDLEKALRLW